MATHATHPWHFFRAGGFNQVKLDTGADLAHLDQLDPKLWVALACPAHGLEFDERTLELLDTDRDGRIRVPEVIAAAKWATSLLKDPDDLLRGSATLPLAAIDARTPEGQQLLASARQTLSNLGRPEAEAISLEDTADTERIFAATRFNGDGIIPVAAAEDPELQAAIADIIACLGPVPDRSGAPGVSLAMVEQFFTEAQGFADGWRQAEADPALLPLGPATPAAFAALQAVRGKVDDYFTRCRLAAFDPRALPALNRPPSDYLAWSGRELSRSGAEAVDFPLARIAPGQPLPLDAPDAGNGPNPPGTGLNPAWAEAMAALRLEVVLPVLGERGVLSEADWRVLEDRFAGFAAWSAGQAWDRVEPLGLPRVRELLASGAQAAITALIARDQALEPEADAIAAVEKLIRFHRDLYALCCNFVNFKTFYDRGAPAVFQAGTLYLDQRSCELTLPVQDTGRHAAMAGLAGAYLAYCDCVSPVTGAHRTVVAILSQGDDDNLMVGRNGIFFDRKGRDYDATITRIVSNPISLRQAFWAPYKKLVRLVEQQIAKRANAAGAESEAQLARVAEGGAAGTAGPVGPAGSVRKEDKKIDVGTVAALGVAVGAISTALAYFLGLFKGIASWQFPLLAAALVLMVSLPSMVLAFMQLRKRNLGPILDANGWAVNAKARITVPFGTSLTGIARLPPGATVEAGDRFAEKASVWPRLLLAAFLLWWLHAYLRDEGWIYRWTDGRWGRSPAEVVRSAAGR
jgi:hypothetical protein